MASNEEERGLRDRLSMAVAELDQDRLQQRFAGIGLTSVAAAPARRPVRIGGEVRSNQMSSFEGKPGLRVSITDGTGSAVAHFTGRRRIRGLEVGRAVLIEGVGHHQAGRLVLLNPAYTLLP